MPFKGSFKEVSRKFQGVSKKFHVACYSLQLSEQKEGFFLYFSAILNILNFQPQIILSILSENREVEIAFNCALTTSEP